MGLSLLTIRLHHIVRPRPATLLLSLHRPTVKKIHIHYVRLLGPNRIRHITTKHKHTKTGNHLTNKAPYVQIGSFTHQEDISHRRHLFYCQHHRKDTHIDHALRLLAPEPRFNKHHPPQLTAINDHLQRQIPYSKLPDPKLKREHHTSRHRQTETV